jgi:ribose/xylose/arabinose/galactoside ABC-type transport system permease subunit
MKLASKPLAVGIAALACVLCLPLMLVVGVISGRVIGGLLAWAGLTAFCASMPLAWLAWWWGSRELATQTSSAPDQPRQALRARSLGRATLLLWALLVLLAALTYTRASGQ